MADNHVKAKLVIVSSRLKNAPSVIGAAQSDVFCVHYKFDLYTTNSLLEFVREKVEGRKFGYLALVMHSHNGGLAICGSKEREQILTSAKIGASDEWDFITSLIAEFTSTLSRMDIVATSLVKNTEGQVLIRSIQDALSSIHLSAWPSFTEEESGLSNEMYFKASELESSSAPSSARVFQPTLAEFEKIRTVGKGAYGTAVLYRKKDDDSLVILKEINMHDLSYTERQLALNEVRVLGMLHHPNIISYYDSFEEDGTLMIEMEYADGGTLAQMLASQSQAIPEYRVLDMFRQMLEACKHLHDHNVLHRDLKTANIFLTKNDMVKLGDFGISKIIETKGASTVLGTPYYISPEMCEGKQYGPKSDVWALGCVLYEMCNREKAFEGSNLPALANKIIKGQFKPVCGSYSSHLREVVDVLLTTDPEKRPSIDIVLNQVLGLVQFYRHREERAERQEVIRSMIYYLDTSLFCLCPIDLPLTCIIRTVSIGRNHVVASTELHSTYSWGEGSHGQLGHGNRNSTNTPQCVDTLHGKFISSVACGNGYTLFVTDNGLLLSCGSANSRCLAQADTTEDVLKPRMCESMLSTDVVAVSCGSSHAALLTKGGAVFTWGTGDTGKLGHGSSIDRLLPTPVTFIEEWLCLKKVVCGFDGTVFLTEDGTLYACGSNKYNKLGLNKRKGFLLTMKALFYNSKEETTVESVNVPTAVKAIGSKRVVEVSVGKYHSSVVVDTGQIYSFGNNKSGQLGVRSFTYDNLASNMESHRTRYVACCETYTVAVTDTEGIYLWGHPPPTNLHDMGLRGVALSDSEDSDMDLYSGAGSGKKARSALTTTDGSLKLPKSLSDPDIHFSPSQVTAKSAKTSGAGVRKTVSERNAMIEMNDMRTTPIEISLTDAARRASASGHPGLNYIKRVVHCDQSLLIQVSTTAPLKTRRKHTGRRTVSSEDNLASSERSESAHRTADEVRKVPTPLEPQPRHLILGGEEEEEEDEMRTWLRMELEDGGITKPSSDLDTSNGLPSSNVQSAKSKDSGFETTQAKGQPSTVMKSSKDNTTLMNRSRVSDKRRLRKKISAVVTEIETTDSDDEALATKSGRYRFNTNTKRGDPYRDKFSLNWRTDVRTNKATELRSKNPSNVTNFKLKSPYGGGGRGVANFSRELECVQEKAELLQEKLSSLEQRHSEQSRELDAFRTTKMDLEEKFSDKWRVLELEKEQTVRELTKYRALLENERNSALQVQGQLESEVRELQTQLEAQKQQLTNQTSVMYELQDVLSSIQQRQNERSSVCSVM